MENQSRIEELLAESLRRFDQLSDKVEREIGDLRRDLTAELKAVVVEIKGVKIRLTKVENEMVKLNMVSAKNTRSLMILAEDHERIDRLEKIVYKH